MSLDLALLGVILVVALLGAVSGAARQISNLVGMVLAYLGARPIGTWSGPWLERAFQLPGSVGIVTGTLAAFVVIWLVCRMVFTRVLQRLFAGEDPESRSVDRTLGFVLAGVKITLVLWIFICALAFVEQNVSVAGKRFGVSPRDSRAFALARRFNIFELTQFAPVKDLATVVTAAADPSRAKGLRRDPAFQRLQKDPRFHRALTDKSLHDAFERGDYRALLRSNLILQLIQDPAMAGQLRTLAGKEKTRPRTPALRPE